MPVSEMAGYGRGGRPWIVFPPVGVLGTQSVRIADIVWTSFDMSALPLLVLLGMELKITGS